MTAVTATQDEGMDVGKVANTILETLNKSGIKAFRVTLLPISLVVGFEPNLKGGALYMVSGKRVVGPDPNTNGRTIIDAAIENIDEELALLNLDHEGKGIYYPRNYDP